MNRQEYKSLDSILSIVNLILFVMGIAIVWTATHNWLAILGTMVASFHIQISIDYLDN